MDNLVKITQEVVNNRKDFETNLNGDEQKALLDILKIGTSAGGARPKAIIAYNEKTGVIKELRERQSFTKPSITLRQTKIKAAYKLVMQSAEL